MISAINKISILRRVGKAYTNRRSWAFKLLGLDSLSRCESKIVLDTEGFQLSAAVCAITSVCKTFLACKTKNKSQQSILRK